MNLLLNLLNNESFFLNFHMFNYKYWKFIVVLSIGVTVSPFEEKDSLLNDADEYTLNVLLREMVIFSFQRYHILVTMSHRKTYTQFFVHI